MRRSVALLVVLFALLALPAMPVASAEDCVAVERNGVMVYPEGCTDGNNNNQPGGGNGGDP